MNWRKLGVVWKPEGNLWWARSHATCPTPWLRPDGILRVYVQCRDAEGVGRVGYVDLDPESLEVLGESAEPVLDVGKPGCFDDNGVLQTCLVRESSGRLRLYYVGFELCHNIRYRLLAGLAISDDDGESFVRFSSTPLLERIEQELYFRGGPYVLPGESGGYRMWYVAGSEWEEIDGKLMPIYDLRYLESDDGLKWPGQGRVVMSPEADEHGLGRPFVVAGEERLQLYYSIRKRAPRAYRMGYAESSDGISWTRNDDSLGLDVSEAEVDGQAIEFAAIHEAPGRTLCFYNGNDFGADGFAVAERVGT